MYGHDQFFDLLKKFSISPDVSLKDVNGFIALHYAASFSHTKICEKLIGYGSEVTSLDEAGRTPL